MFFSTYELWVVVYGNDSSSSFKVKDCKVEAFDNLKQASEFKKRVIAQGMSAVILSPDLREEYDPVKAEYEAECEMIRRYESSKKRKAV